MGNRRHLNVIPGTTVSDEPRPAPRLPRDIVLAVIVVAILLAGVGAGGAFPPQPDAVEPQPGTTAAGQQNIVLQPSSEFVYFPDQHVNQGKEVPEHIHAF